MAVETEVGKGIYWLYSEVHPAPNRRFAYHVLFERGQGELVIEADDVSIAAV